MQPKPNGTDTADHAGHELLLRLAGRLPDELLWRLRDWLAAAERTAISAMLPRTLMSACVGLTDGERELLVDAVGGWGAPRRLLDAVLPVHVSGAPVARFRLGPPADLATLSMLAVIRGHPGATELRQCVRVDGHREQRIVLVTGGDTPWLLTGTLQRLLRAHGDRTPCVEVLPEHLEPPAYHRAAIAGSTSLWRATTPAAAPAAGRRHAAASSNSSRTSPGVLTTT